MSARALLTLNALAVQLSALRMQPRAALPAGVAAVLVVGLLT